MLRSGKERCEKGNESFTLYEMLPRRSHNKFGIPHKKGKVPLHEFLPHTTRNWSLP